MEELNNRALAKEMIIKTILGGEYIIVTSHATLRLQTTDAGIEIYNTTLEETHNFKLNDKDIAICEEFIYEVLNHITLYRYYEFGDELEEITINTN